MKNRLFAFSAIVGAMLFILPTSVHAIISPGFVDIKLTPGQNYSGYFDVAFERGGPDTMYLWTEQLDISDSTGTEFSRRVSRTEQTLANWIRLGRTVITKPESITYTNGDNVVKIPYTMSIPADAEPGGHYAAIIVSSRPEQPQGGNQVAINKEEAFQILVTMDGNQKLDTALEWFRTKNNQLFFSNLPIEFEANFVNKGNIHVIPRGNIEVFQSGGKIANIALNSGQERVLPERTRIYSNTWEEANGTTQPITFFDHVMYQLNNFRLGYYTAELQGYAGQQPPFKASVGFWIIPIHLIIVLVGIAALILGFIWARMRITQLQKGSKRKNQSK